MTTNTPNRQPTARVAAIAAATVIAAGVASLAGCTGDDPIVTEKPSATATTSATPSASPSASPTPLTDAELLALMPPEAAYPDVRGAIATAQFFTEQYAVMFQTGDVRIIEALSDERCSFCAEALAAAAEEVAAGEFETGGEVVGDGTQVRANLHTGDGFTYVDFPFTQSPTTLHRADGSSELTDPSSSGRVYYRMGFVDQVWRVIGAEVQSGA